MPPAVRAPQDGSRYHFNSASHCTRHGIAVLARVNDGAPHVGGREVEGSCIRAIVVRGNDCTATRRNSELMTVL